MSASGNLSTNFARVYVDYQDETPMHPGKSWTRFVCISDTHSRTFPVPDGDVLLHAGDLSSWGYPQQLKTTLTWLRSLPHPMKIIIAGNHDLCLDASLPEIEQVRVPREETSLEALRLWMKSQALYDSNIRYLQHESTKFTTYSGREWIVYGSPSAPQYARGSFQYSTAEEAQAVYQQIPPETEILLTHTPPHLILDKTRRGVDAGCPHLADRLSQLKRTRLHVFGHIHEAWGASIPEPGHTVFVNAALPHPGARAIIADLRN